MQIFYTILGIIFCLVLVGVIVYNTIGIVKTIKQRRAEKKNNDTTIEDMEKGEN